jgi:hypothetical protein
MGDGALEWIRRNLPTVQGRLLTGLILIAAVVAGLWPDHERPADGVRITAIVVAAVTWLFAELSGIAAPSQHDLALFERFRSTLHERDRAFLRDQDFDNSFSGDDMAGLREIASWTGVAYEFNDAKLEKEWAAAVKAIDAFVAQVAQHTGPVNAGAGRFSAHPSNSDPMEPADWITKAISSLNAQASLLGKQLEEFERKARRRLGL